MDWIDINERTPEDGQKVLTYFKELDNNPIEIASYKNLEGTEDEIFGKNLFYNKNGYLTDDVTHWMPLPEPPDVD
jgi:hypothetical protein